MATQTMTDYTHKIARWEIGDLGVVASITKAFLPNDLEFAYGGSPFTGKIFAQLGGMKMWDLSL